MFGLFQVIEFDIEYGNFFVGLGNFLLVIPDLWRLQLF